MCVLLERQTCPVVTGLHLVLKSVAHLTALPERRWICVRFKMSHIFTVTFSSFCFVCTVCIVCARVFSDCMHGMLSSCNVCVCLNTSCLSFLSLYPHLNVGAQ